jgi:YidC/Oxa1 family membrane protein insertase
MKEFFTEILYKPLYNSLVGLIDIIPGGDIGLAVIILTLIVKFILFPLSAAAIRTKIQMKEVEGDLKEIKEKYKNDREQQGRKMLELYREKKINPFAGILVIFIQIPVIITLFLVFKSGFPEINPELLYSFIPQPDSVGTNFLGFIDLAKNKNLLVALLVGVSQYYQMKVVLSDSNKKQDDKKPQTPAEEMMKMMNFQMKFIMPIITSVISFSLITVVGIYWFVANIFAIGQEIYTKKKLKNLQETQE